METLIFSLYSYYLLENLAEHHFEKCCQSFLKVVILCGENTPQSCEKELFLKTPFKSDHFALVTRMVSSSKSPKWLNPPWPCHRPFLDEQLWLYFPGGDHRALLDSSQGLCAEDWKIWIRPSGKRLTLSFWALKNRASPQVWTDVEGTLWGCEFCLARSSQNTTWASPAMFIQSSV